MPALFQFLRTQKDSKDTELNKRKLEFGEPLFIRKSKSDVAIVMGDGENNIEDLPKFTALPADKIDMGVAYPFNNIYYISKDDKYYLVDKNGNEIDVIGGGTSSLIYTFTETLTVAGWVESTHEGIYEQFVSIPTIRETNSTTIDVIVDDLDNYIHILSGWRFIIKAIVTDGGITFYAYQKPTLALTFQAQAIIDKNEVMVERHATILANNWTQVENKPYYYQDIKIENVKSINNATIDISIDLDNYKQQLQQWGRIIKINTQEGTIRVYASTPTEINLDIKMFVYTLSE